MAKSMALIENGTVANMLWCSDSEPETDILINPADRPVGIGDTYSNGKFYRGGDPHPAGRGVEKERRVRSRIIRNRSCSGGERMTIEERKQRILAKIAEMKAEGADMQNALTILEVKPDEVE